MHHNCKFTGWYCCSLPVYRQHSHDLFDNHPGPTFDCQGELSSVEDLICHPEGDLSKSWILCSVRYTRIRNYRSLKIQS